MVRQQLEKYIWKQSPVNNAINARAFIESRDTAVVEIYGVIPALSSSGDTFDVALRPLSNSQTTSLDGGYLYATDLKELSRLARIEQFSMFSKTMATVEGPVFSDKLSKDDENSSKWYVLGGGSPIHSSKIRLVLNQPDFLTANAIRNRINERFKSKTAVPLSEAEIMLNIPSEYRDQKQRFLDMVSSLQLGTNFEMRQSRIDQLIAGLVSEPENETFSVALEAIGRPALDSMVALLSHPDEPVRFQAASCMLNIGDKRGLKTLRDILLDPLSPFRLRATHAIGRFAGGTEARAVLTVALNDNDIQLRLAAYEMLLRMNSPAVSRKIIAGDFVVDSVICPGPKIIYAYREKTPRIVLFGAPVYCNKNIFLQSDDGTITINASPDAQFISVSRKHPQRPRVIGPMKAGFEVSSLIQSLGERPETKSRVRSLPGLAVSYDQILPLLEKMCSHNAIDAAFITGPPVLVDPILQNLPPIGR